MKKAYIFSAVSSEHSCLAKNLPQRLQIEYEIFSLGIGLLESAMNIGKLIVNSTPDLMIFLGTCGVTKKSGISIGSVVIPKTAYLMDFDRLRPFDTKETNPELNGQKDAYFPGPMTTKYDFSTPNNLDQDNPFSFPIISRVNMANPLAISNSQERGSLLSFKDIQSENLEAISIAAAGANLQIPVYTILGVSNLIGPKAHSQWLKHRNLAEQNSCQVLIWLLQRGF